MANTLEKSSFASGRHDEDFNLKDWGLKARVTRENTSSRRFSASYLRSFREEARSFRSNVTINSAASSPGYTIREEIDPSRYSFTAALKALQAKTVYTWEYLSPDAGLTLHSKWNDAEKYICNPLSGEVPLECLSAKTLSARSFRSRITMSAPLIYSSPLHQFHANNPIKEHEHEHENEAEHTVQEKTKSPTRDVGIQSTTEDISSSSPSPFRTPSIEERSIKHCVAQDDSPVFSVNSKSEKEVEVKGTGDEECTETNEGQKKVRKQQMMYKCQGGCLSLKVLWMRKRPKEKSKH